VVTLGPAEARWIAVALRVPPETAAEQRPWAHEIHFQVDRVAGGGDGPASQREKSTFVVPR
jgi:hypothetical protein